MAYNVRKINVLDLQPSKGIGVALPFDARAVFKTVFTTKEQLKYNIINFLLTNKRERIFNPTFGANIRSKVFEQLSDNVEEELDAIIRTGIAQYFPNVVITNLTVISEPNSNSLRIQFSYDIANTGTSDNILIGLNG